MGCIWTLTILSLFAHGFAHEVTASVETKVLLTKSNFHLTCLGEGQLSWNFYPDYLIKNYKELQSNGGKEISNREYRGSALLKHKPHRFVLKINSSQIEDTGIYECLVDGKVVNTTHVFVHDEDLCINNLVPTTESNVVIVNFGDTFVIPCRATRPNISVFVINPSGEKIESDYDPMKGFTVQDASVRHEGLWACEVKAKPECTDRLPIYQEFYVPSIDKDVINPTIQETSPYIIDIGEKVCIQCSVCTLYNIKLEWISPTGAVIKSSDRFAIQESSKRGARDFNPIEIISVLNINNATVPDSGNYRCNVTGMKIGSTSIQVEIKENADGDNISLHFMDGAGVHRAKEDELPKDVQWVVGYSPRKLTVNWFSPNGTRLSDESSNKKHNMNRSSTEKTIKFSINNATLEDAGIYQVMAKHRGKTATLNLSLVIEFTPSVRFIVMQKYLKPGDIYTFECHAMGYPPADIVWNFTCFDNERAKCIYKIHQSNSSHSKEIQGGANSEIELSTDRSGNLSCTANNTMGSAHNSTTLVVSEYDGPQVKSSLRIVYEGDSFTITCSAPKYPCNRDWEWTCQKNETQAATILTTGPNLNIQHLSTNYSSVSQVVFRKIGLNQSGIYNCKAKCRKETHVPIEKLYKLDVKTIRRPTFNNPKVALEKTVTEYSAVEFDCEADADPQPRVTWSHKNEELTRFDHFNLIANNMTLRMPKVLAADDGEYKCRLTSRNSTIERTFSLSVKTSKWNPVVLIPIVIVLLLLVSVVIYLWRAVKKEKKKVQQLTAHEIKMFLDGATENIDHDVALDQQADLLPYNPNYEYARENLKLGRQLGAGAFGRVLRGEATAPLFGASADFDHPSEQDDAQTTTIVAVKMVKGNAELSQIKALMTELKILIHVGKHLNVVNLLGACTSNLNKKELLVIVEYCKYGNLHTYLLKQRDNFVDQVNHLKDTVDFTIGTEDDDVHHYQNRSVIMEQKQVLFKKETRTIIYDPQPDADNKYHGEATSTTDGSSATEHWTTKYRSDFKGELKKITTKDLVCWSYQVARGMQYLASRRIVHADLAARNILLAEHNVVKICDFGLARNLYNDANYLKKGDDPLPVKWMAIESIQDRVFSTESDVWSFGVVLWEFFTLAKTPYPGIPLDERFINRLIGGYRMEKPAYSTLQIYTIMKRCWDKSVSNRPQFSELVNLLGQILDDNVKQFYLELSGPYIRMNSLHHEYEQDFRASFLKETATRKEAIPSVGCEREHNGVSNPTYMMVQGTSRVDKDYVNVPKNDDKEGASLNASPPEGYLKMSPILPKPEKSPKASDESIVNL